jgi:hypothetical protein
MWPRKKKETPDTRGHNSSGSGAQSKGLKQQQKRVSPGPNKSSRHPIGPVLPEGTYKIPQRLGKKGTVEYFRWWTPSEASQQEGSEGR